MSRLSSPRKYEPLIFKIYLYVMDTKSDGQTDRVLSTPFPQTLLVRVLLKRTTNRIISITIDDPTLMQRPPQIFKWFYLSYIKWTFNVLNNKCLISLIDFWIKKWWNMAAVPEQSFPIFFFLSFYVFFSWSPSHKCLQNDLGDHSNRIKH